MSKKQIGLFSSLFLLIPLTIILLYFWGAFLETGIIPLPQSISTPLLIGSFVTFLLSFCYLSGRLNVLQPSTSITKEQDGRVARVVKSSVSGEEYFVRAEPEKTLRQVLMEQWPFDKNNSNSKWYVIDESGAEITDNRLSDFEGTVEIVFEE